MRLYLLFFNLRQIRDFWVPFSNLRRNFQILKLLLKVINPILDMHFLNNLPFLVWTKNRYWRFLIVVGCENWVYLVLNVVFLDIGTKILRFLIGLHWWCDCHGLWVVFRHFHVNFWSNDAITLSRSLLNSRRFALTFLLRQIMTFWDDKCPLIFFRLFTHLNHFSFFILITLTSLNVRQIYFVGFW